MLKNERLLKIRNWIKHKGIVTVSEISKELNVSTMTVRRDLDELSNRQEIIRIHGGAQSINLKANAELSRMEKRKINVKAKQEIAQIIAGLIKPGDAVYLGPGTTIELVANYLKVDNVRIITNSLPVFLSFQDKADRYSLNLVGGSYRARSGAFIGNLANEVLERLKTNKAFISVNGIHQNDVSNANPEEGQTQQIAMNNAQFRYVVGDHSKLNHQDLYPFYRLNVTNGLITDSSISGDDLKNYEKFTKVITKIKKK